MTLTSCPECSGQVSSEALRCPHCGHPVRSWRRLMIFAVVVLMALLGFVVARS